MKPPSVLIAEDEPVLRAELRATLAKLWPELQFCPDAEDGIQALHALETEAPDILFLDIQMPGMNGLEVARKASGRCHVVFVTAYDNYAVAAFDEGAIDYVLKPFSVARLATAVSRLKQKLESAPANLDGMLKALGETVKANKEYIRWIQASIGNELHLITLDEILYFRADTKYTLVVTADQEALIRRPIKELAEEVDPAVFWQIHRSTLVNVNAIATVTRDMSGHLRVKLKQRKEMLTVSASYTHLFKQM